MKRILITGANSFVGSSVRKYLENWPDKYTIQCVSMRNEAWKQFDFSGFDTVYHVAGLAHADVRKVDEETKNRYYQVNTRLAIDIAKKAKEEGVRQYIFMSSSIVYGDSAPIGKEKTIRRDTPCSPVNFYGDSKLQAEKGLSELEDQSFRLVILRCPMIYGEGCKGNFAALRKLALKLPAFPMIENRRSMLYIGNLAEFVRLMIDNEESGIFWPCNRELSNTSRLVGMIAAVHGKRILLVPGFSWALKGLSHVDGYVNKAFGSFTYEEGLGDYKCEYRLYSLEQSIRETEGR